MTDVSVPPDTRLTIDDLQGAPARVRREHLVRGIALGAALWSVVVSILILASLFREAWTFITQVEWSSTWGQTGWYPRRGIYDIPSILVPTIIVTVIAMVVAGPVGLGAAIYLSEYARPRVRAWLKPILEILAGIPSVVLGFFALTFIAPEVVGRITKTGFLVVGLIVLGLYCVAALAYGRRRLKRVRDGESDPSAIIGVTAIFAMLAAVFVAYLLWMFNTASAFERAGAGSLAAAGIGVGILTIPLVASVSEDAMAAVPNSLREASAGLGARKMATSTTVVVPAAISGIVAAFIVATSRAIGETMVVFLAGGAADAAAFTDSPFDGGLTMTAAMASLASGTDSVVGEGLTFQSLFFVGLLLFFITLVLNMAAARFVARVREQY